MTRFWQVLKLAIDYRFGPKAERGVRLREGFDRLGGLWVKVGQLLSYRYDILPADVCAALRSLQGTRQGKPGYAAVVLAREFGDGWIEHITELSHEPVAAAGIGQIHRGTLADGTAVAVKVVLDGGRELYAADLTLARRLGFAVDIFFRHIRAIDMAKELRAVATEELDLRYECQHQRRLGRKLRKRGIRVPKVYRHLSTANVLVMDWVEGVTMTDVLAKDEPIAWMKLEGFNPTKLCRRWLRTTYRAVLEWNHFHGDPHPGNWMLHNRKSYAIDFGTCSRTDREFLDTFRDFLKAVSVHDFTVAADNYALLCIWGGIFRRVWLLCTFRGYTAACRRELVRVMSEWAQRASIEELPFEDKSITRLSNDLMCIIRKSGGSVRWDWLRITRAFMALEATIGRIWPDVNYPKELQRYMAGAAKRQPWPTIHPAAIAQSMSRIAEGLEEYQRLRRLRLRWQSHSIF